MIDSASPITIFTQADLPKILIVDVIPARSISSNEKYVDYNNQPLNLKGFIRADVQLEQKKIKNARTLITRDGKRSLIVKE